MSTKKKVFDQFRDYLSKAEALLTNNANAPMAVIECDIVLEQLRSLYVAVSDYRNGDNIKNAESSLFAPPEPMSEPAPMMPPVINSIEGNPYDDLFAASGNIVSGTARLANNINIANSRMEAEEAARKAAAEEAARKAAAEEAARKAAAEEAARKAAAEEAARKAATNTGSLKDLLSQNAIGQRTLAEQLGQRSAGFNGSNEARMGQNRITDLRSAISINDKFSFLTEMFHNQLKEYNDFIMKLNAFTVREDALAYVNMVAQEYNWDRESITVKTFFSLFDRKF